MGQLKKAIMAVQYDDMGSDDLDTIKEIKIINDFMEGNDWGEVDLPEGYGGDDCND